MVYAHTYWTILVCILEFMYVIDTLVHHWICTPNFHATIEDLDDVISIY